MKILAVDCSAGPASAAIFEDGKVLASSFCNVKITHSETLMPMIKNTLSSALLTLKDVDAVAFIRFASVYRDFKDIETFRDEINKIMKN